MSLVKSLGLAAALLAPVGLAIPGTAQAAPPTSFARCAACHNAEKGAGPKIGPNLYGVYGRKAASGTFSYSTALKNAKLTWNDATLDKWLTGPMQMVPGTLMSFPGLKDPAKRAELIAWLKTLH